MVEVRFLSYAIQPSFFCLGGASFLGQNFKQFSPEVSKTTWLGIRLVLKANALQPLGEF